MTAEDIVRKCCGWTNTDRQYFWCREMCHVGGGMLIGLVSQISQILGHDVSVIMRICIGSALFATIATKEVKEDLNPQPRFKTLMDVLSWTVGYVVIALI